MYDVNRLNPTKTFTTSKWYRLYLPVGQTHLYSDSWPPLSIHLTTISNLVFWKLNFTCSSQYFPLSLFFVSWELHYSHQLKGRQVWWHIHSSLCFYSWTHPFQILTKSWAFFYYINSLKSILFPPWIQLKWLSMPSSSFILMALTFFSLASTLVNAYILQTTQNDCSKGL